MADVIVPPQVANTIIVLGIINSESNWDKFGVEEPSWRDQGYLNRNQDIRNLQYTIARGGKFNAFIAREGKNRTEIFNSYNPFQRSAIGNGPNEQKNIVILKSDVSDFSHDDYKVVYSDSGRIWFVKLKDNTTIAGTVVCIQIGNGSTATPYLPQYTINLDTPVKGKTTYVGKTPKLDDRYEDEGDYKPFMALLNEITANIKGVPVEDFSGGGGGGGGSYSAPPPPPPPKGPILLNVYNNLKFNDEDINEFVSVNQTHTKLLLKELSKYQPPSTGSNKTEQQLPPSFLPFELSLDVDGISGMVLFQKFLVTNDVFPPQYEDNFDLIVTGVNHTVNPQGWNTSIKTRVTPSDPKNKDVLRPQVLDKNPNTP